MSAPQFVIIAGPNGAGKSTSAPALLPDGVPYLNADEIAKQLSGLEPGISQDVAASRRLLQEWGRCADARTSFAIETTLASKSIAPKIKRLKQVGYEFHLIFLWLPSADLAVARVQDRIKRGGHAIPEATIRRRYISGINNLIELYMPLADTWTILHNRESGSPLPIAHSQNEQRHIYEEELWKRIQSHAGKH